MHATRRPSSIALALLAAAVLTVVAVGCGTSGRTLRDPKPGATAPPRKSSTTATTAAVQAIPSLGLSISSTGWAPGEEIPRGYTCDGQKVSPPLTISGAPESTVELVLVVSDQDARGFLHWVVAGIPPGTPSFPQGQVPPGAIEAPNGSGGVAWVGPCPPAGSTHTYDFTVYALTAASGLDAISTPAQLDAALQTASSTAAMTGTYTRS